MTCLNVQLLLEDYVEGELSQSQTEEVRRHLDNCPACRNEHESTLRLKELLRQKTINLPGKDYLAETFSLILARTVESSPESTRITPVTYDSRLQRSAFIRSVVSTVAALLVLFSALMLGSSQQSRLARLETSKPMLFVSAPIEKVIGSENAPMYASDEEIRLTKGMLMLSPPGLLGRFVAPVDFGL